MMKRLRNRRRNEDGSVAMEAALVTPILLILVFGIIEFSFAMRDYVVVVSDSRVGARIAAAGAGFGPGDCPVKGEMGAGDEPCVPNTVPKLAQAAATAIQNSGSAMPAENINYILVYQANDDGYPGTNSSMSGNWSCAGSANCVRFKWYPSTTPGGKGKFDHQSGKWPSAQISACFPGSNAISAGGKKKVLEKVGVYVNTTHQGMTGLFFDQLRLNDHAVLNFEPMAASNCGAGEHS